MIPKADLLKYLQFLKATTGAECVLEKIPNRNRQRSEGAEEDAGVGVVE